MTKLIWGLVVIMMMPSMLVSQETLGLNDAIQAALESTYAKNAKLMKNVSDLDRKIYQKLYAPSISIEGEVSSDQSEKGNAFVPDTESRGLSATYEQTFASGTQLTGKASLTSQELDYTTFSDESYTDSMVSISLEQDIWRNAFGFQDQIGQYSQDIQKNVQYLEIADALEETIYQATVGFWAVVLADKSQATYRQSMDNARKVYELNLEKEKTGLAEPRTVHAFRANWLKKKQQYEQSVYNYDKTMDHLMTFLEMETTPQLSEAVDTYMAIVSSANLSYNWERQSEHLRRYQIAQLQDKGHALAVAQALDNVKPQVVVFGLVGINAVEDKIAAPSFENLNTQVGIRVDFSPTKYPQYELQRQQLRQAIQDNTIALLENDLQLQLKEAGRYTQWLKADLELSKQIELTLEKKYQEDERQFDAGRINVDELLQSDDSYMQSRLATLKATYDYLQAIGYYFRVENTLLDKIGILAERINQKES